MKLKSFIYVFALLASTSIHADTLQTTLAQHHLPFILAAYFGLGILLAFTPCVLPMVPILSAILIGQHEQGKMKNLRLSLVFVISMACTYAVAGLMAGYLGSTLQTWMQQPWIITAFSFIFVLMALSMFGYFHLALPAFLQNRLQHVNMNLQSGHYISVAVMGVLSTLIASPCVTAPLISVLTFVSQTGDALQGGLILFTLAMGMGVPLILFGVSQTAFLPKTGVWMEQVKKIFGVMMLGLAIWMISRIIPGVATLFLTASLLIVSAVAFGALNLHAEKRLSPVLHGVSVLALVYGVLLLTGAASGHDNIFNPLTVAYSNDATDAPRPTSSLFTYIQTLPRLEAELAKAANERKAVMIEFYANWCPDCKVVDKEVFASTEVRKQMKAVKSIRVDVSEHNPALAAMMEKYGVVGVPTVVFFDKSGERFDANKSEAEITKEYLLTTLRTIS